MGKVNYLCYTNLIIPLFKRYHMESETVIPWRARPSVFLYAGSYLTAAIVVYFIIKLQYSITDNPIDAIRYAVWPQSVLDLSTNDLPLLALIGSDLLIVFMLLYVALKFLKTRFTEYLLMNDQLVVRKFIGLGVVEYRTEMYRMVDFSQVQMAAGGIFGFSTITLRSTDILTPVIRLEGVKNANKVIELLRSVTEQCRQKKHIQEFVSPHMSTPPGRAG